MVSRKDPPRSSSIKIVLNLTPMSNTRSSESTTTLRCSSPTSKRLLKSRIGVTSVSLKTTKSSTKVPVSKDNSQELLLAQKDTILAALSMVLTLTFHTKYGDFTTWTKLVISQHQELIVITALTL